MKSSIYKKRSAISVTLILLLVASIITGITTLFLIMKASLGLFKKSKDKNIEK